MGVVIIYAEKRGKGEKSVAFYRSKAGHLDILTYLHFPTVH